MPPFRRLLPALLTGGALLLTSGSPAALALEGGPTVAAAETTLGGAANATPAVRWEKAALTLDTTHTTDAGGPGTGPAEAAPPEEEVPRGVDGTPDTAGARDPAPGVGMDDTGISVDNGTSRVEVEPDGVRVDTPGTRVEVARGTYVLVCANGVRVEVRVGEAPPCEPHPEQPERPEWPGYPEPEPEPEPSEPPAPGDPAPEAPAPEEPEAPEDVPPAETRPSPTAPAEERVEEAASSTPPSASPSPVPEVPEAVREQMLADVSPPSGRQAAGAFTPMRTMMVLVVVVAVAATGAGRAAARASG
ncbi:hypothetical protein [Nocardiopsis halotolerans]|uniref:hypothetical protein n=1 Tax=Nocardiopsis halotolerans TaxID=124252 RepID=UPI0003467FCA|nr:hypothetical protein [Nocardiopsis halotolerans]